MKKRFSTFYVANKHFWTMKTSVSKSHKVRIFLKGLVHGLVENLTFCCPFVLYKIYRKKIFADILVRKQAFLDNTTMNFKKREIGIS